MIFGQGVCPPSQYSRRAGPEFDKATKKFGFSTPWNHALGLAIPMKELRTGPGLLRERHGIT
jgi:hypothetical protein